ncbi:hypothetical protein ABZW11_40520 [Nonomuraea sp. NPDC004580]|uniref:hypothetical protein n=1 Tax=Nonomuraea sp. NPDC004580 TaxID=3154552 RepID=UPI0033AC6208
MSRRALVWSGSAVAVVALAGLVVYVARAGLDEADKLAGVIGAFVGLAGLGVSVYGMVRGDPPAGPGPGSVVVKGDNSGVIATGDAADVRMTTEPDP